MKYNFTMKNRLQLRHSDQLFASKNDVIEYLKNTMIFEEGKQALFAEPLVFKYGEDETNPNIILAIGSYGDGTNNTNNKYFLIDSATLEHDVDELKKFVNGENEEILKIKDDIEALKTKDSELSKVLGDVGNALQFEIDRAKAAEEKLTSDLTNEISRATELDNIHDAKISENKTSITNEIDRATAAEKSLEVYTEDSNTIHLTKAKNEAGTTVSASLKLSQERGQKLKVLSTDGGITEGLYLNVGLNYDDNTGELSLVINDEVVNKYNLPLEQFLDSEQTRYDDVTKKIILAFKEQGKDTKFVEIPIGDLVDTYTAGNGLKVENNQFSVKLNQSATEDFIIVDEDGIAIKGVESKINEIVNNESERAKAAENKLTSDLSNEITRATESEALLQQKINDESNRATQSETTLQNNIDAEVLRATGVESGLTQRLDANVLNINQLNSKILAETERATNVENQLSSTLTEVKDGLTKESERAQSSESQITTNYIAADAEILRQSKEYVDTKTTEESNRAQSAEKEIKDIIGSEFSTSNTITAQLANEVQNRKDSDSALRIDIDALSGSSATKVALEEETDNRTAKDSELENKIATNSSNISTLSDSLRTYSIKKIIPGDTGTTASYELIDDKGARCGEVINIPLDQILQQAEYDSMSKKLILTFSVGTGTTKTEIDVADLIDEYVAGDGINISENTVSIKRDSSSEGFLSLSNAGLKLSGIQNAIDSGITTERQRAEASEEALSSDVEELKSKLDNTATKNELEAEVNRAKAAEYIGSDNTNKTVEIVVSPKEGGGNILSTNIKTSAYVYDLPTSGETQYSLLGKLSDGTLFAMNSTNAMRHKFAQESAYTNLETVINNLKNAIDINSNNIDEIQKIATSALTLAEEINTNLQTLVKQYVTEALSNPEVIATLTNNVKSQVISADVFKQKVPGDTDVTVEVADGTVTIGLGDNCIINAEEYA